MNYQEAQNVRGKGFASMMTDKMLGGQGIGQSFKSTVSDKTKATMKGIKQKFDPLNIAKKLTFGSNLGPALLGKMTGRSKEDVEFFAGGKKGGGAGKVGQSAAVSGVAIDFATEILGEIYKLLQQIEEDKKLTEQLKQNKEEEEQSESDRRNEEIIAAITGRRKKKPSRRAEAKKKKEEVKRKKQEKREEKKVEGKPKAEPTKKEAPKPPEKVTTSKPPSPSAGRIVGGVAIATTAAIAGKEALAANISKFESGKAGYNAYNKGTIGNKMIPSDEPIDFSKMTIAEYLKRGDLKSGDPRKIFAVGRYQIIPKTMKGLVKTLKIDPETTYLDPPTQDLLFSQGLTKSNRKKVDDYITGKTNDRDGAILQLAQEFASVGIPYDMNIEGKNLKRGDSYYSGIGGNKAHNPPEQVGAALDADRQKYMSNKSPMQVPTDNSAPKIENSTKQNQQLKKDLTAQQKQNVSERETTNIRQTSSQISSVDSVDDRPAPIKKSQG